MGIEKFDILAHSFGAFLSAHYINLYTPNVGRFYMCSPAGFTKLNKEAIKEVRDG